MRQPLYPIEVEQSDLLVVVVVVAPVRLDQVARLLPDHDGRRVSVSCAASSY
jgi:hypothetical protein